MQWRVLPFRIDDAYTNMAIDKTIAESVAAGTPPTVRFYQWSNKGAISFGAGQSSEDFDKIYCNGLGVQYVRRFTGGRVMYHSPCDVTYAIAAPTSLYKNRLELANDTSRWIMEFLEQLGLKNIQYNGYGCILTEGKKISGSAPHYEKRNAILHHGGVYCAADYALLAKIFKVSESFVRDRIMTVAEHQEIKKGNLVEKFENVFLKNLSYSIGDLTKEEWERVQALRAIYASSEWMEKGTLTMGICSINWVAYPDLKVPEDLRPRLIAKGTEQELLVPLV